MPITNSCAPRRAILRPTLALLVSVALAACGGEKQEEGLGDPPRMTAPSTPVTMNTANSESVVTAALAAVMGDITSPAVGQMPMGVAVEAEASPATHVLSRITSQAVRRLAAAPTVTGVSQTAPCAISGTVAMTAAQTWVKFTFNQCSDFEGEVLNGWLAVLNVSGYGDEVSGSFTGTVWLDLYVTLSGTTSRMAGDYTVSSSYDATSDTTQLSGGSLGYSDDFNTTVLSNYTLYASIDWSMSRVTTSADFTLASTVLGGAVNVDTQAPFVQEMSSIHPYTGIVVVTGAGGTKVRVTVWDDEYGSFPQLTVEVDEDGDGTYEWVTDLDWAALGAGTPT